MSVNKHRPHLLVVPEDDANRQIANGFVIHHEVFEPRQIQVLPVEGGWLKVRDRLVSMQLEMRKYPERHVVALVDFDRRPERRKELMSAIDTSLHDRVFVLGVDVEPEALKRDGLGSYEAIGKALAQDCASETNNTWQHARLSHNRDEIVRMAGSIRPILFR